ncbi:hypothetical protein ACHAWC_008364 [Mediolabrus comicus]
MKKRNHASTTAKSNKRPREEEQATDAPQYGSKEYWEARYKSHLPDADVQQVSRQSDDAVGTTNTGNQEEKYVLDGVELSKEATNPFHAWYFTYDELRPLILPLIFGGDGDEDVEDEYDDNDDDDDGDSWVEEEEIVVEEEEEENDLEGKNDDEIVGKDENHDEEGESELSIAPISPQDTPKKILEVGCGDVPLGAELALDILNMSKETGTAANLVVNEISCIDYSEIVVKTLIEKQKKESNDSSSMLQVSFDALDARDLPYAANTYDLVLEKGTLDAMLSDQKEGIHNCIQIVKEMARVTNDGGSILIVSHLNANEAKGMGWLEDVVFNGLKEEFKERHDTMAKQPKANSESSTIEADNKKEYVWSVEVHGGEGRVAKGNNDEDEINIGPAVYILRKKSVPATIARELYSKKKDNVKDVGESDSGGDDDQYEMTMPPVKLQFLCYD